MSDISDLFTEKKFFCFSPTKSNGDKLLKELILKKIEGRGGSLQYCVQKFSTNFIIICNSLEIYDRDETYFSVQSNNQSYLEKSKSYNIPMVSYKFITDSLIRGHFIEDYSKYIVTEIKDDNTILSFTYNKLKKVTVPPTETPSKFIKKSSTTITTTTPQREIKTFKSSYYTNRKLTMNNQQSKSLEEKEAEESYDAKSDEDSNADEIFDLFGDYDDSNSGNKVEEENENTIDMYDTDFFDMFTNNAETKVEEAAIAVEEEGAFDFLGFGYEDSSKSSSLNKKEYKKLEDLDIQKLKSGFIFQFINQEISLYHEKEFPNLRNEIKLFEQSPNGLSCMITKEIKHYVWGSITSGDKVKPELTYQADYCSVGVTHAFYVKKQTINSVGTNKFGQLGITYSSPKIINDIRYVQTSFEESFTSFGKKEKVLMVSCGKDFTIILTNQSNLYGVGKNDHGQLGLGLKFQSTNEYHLIKFNNNDNNVKSSSSSSYISYISCGDNHCVAIESSCIDEFDTFYGWGSNSQGQIGDKHSSIPNKINYQSGSKDNKIFCNKDSTWIISDTPSVTGSTSLKIKVFGIGNQTLYDNLISNFKSCNEFKLVPLKKKIGVLVLNCYLKGKFLLNSTNYNENYHYHLLEQLIFSRECTVEDASILARDCCSVSNLNVFKLLEKRYPSKLIDLQKDCPLQMAASFGPLKNNNNNKFNGCSPSKSILEYCISEKLYSLDHPNLKLERAIHICSRNGNYEIATLLLLAGCNRDSKNSNGQTPLHISVSFEQLHISSLLCKHGAQSIPDKTMKTPLQYCNSSDTKTSLQNILFTNEVFISYAHKDSEFVNNLRSNFGLFSLRCWLDEYRLQAGCNWRAEITKGVENSNVVVFVVSETSINSLWCRKELKMSKKLGKTIIPLFLQHVKIDPILYGLFTFLPKQSKPTYSEMSNNERIENVESISNVIHSILKNNGVFNQNQPKPSQEQSPFSNSINNESTCFIAFNAPDRILFDFISNRLHEIGIPNVSDDQFFGKPSDDEDPYSLKNKLLLKKQSDKQRKINQENEKKLKLQNDEKIKQQWKINRKIEKKLQKSKLDENDPTYQYLKSYYTQLYNNGNNEKEEINSHHHHQANNHQHHQVSHNQHHHDQFDEIKEIEIPILNSFTSDLDFNNGYGSGDIEQSTTTQLVSNNSVYYDDGIQTEEDFYKGLANEQINIKYQSIQIARDSIDNSLLFIVLYTKKTSLIDMTRYLMEIEYVKSQCPDKTIIVISPDTTLIDSPLTPSILKDLTWYEIEERKIDTVFDNISLIYEVVEKTLQISNIVKNLENTNNNDNKE